MTVSDIIAPRTRRLVKSVIPPCWASAIADSQAREGSFPTELCRYLAPMVINERSLSLSLDTNRTFPSASEAILCPP